MTRKTFLNLAICLLPLCNVFAGEKTLKEVDKKLPPMETFVIEPLEIENECLWVPAAKIGPVINRACQTKEDSCSCVLPATVNHSKTESCPDDIARLLAEQVACYHEKSLPLTIFNGWQWEYLYSLSQYDSKIFDMEKRGGSWENSWEAILTCSIGQSQAQWISVSASSDIQSNNDENIKVSNIEIKTFNDMRTRDEYPRIRQMD